MFGLNMFLDSGPQMFTSQYKCFPICMMPGNERQDVEKGGKIIMPPSALEHLTRLNIVYPMLFKLTNPKSKRETHCGVLEFVADEGKMYIPYWMMLNLSAEEGTVIYVESAILPVAKFSKFQPQSIEFLDISDPKAVLENALRSFACLTIDDMIAIYYNGRQYELRVLETKPGAAVSIIECDMNVEFTPPVGYQEPDKQPSTTEAPQQNINIDSEEDSDEQITQFVPFSGGGVRLDGKQAKNNKKEEANNSKSMNKRGIPNYNYKPGYLKFFRSSKFNNNNDLDKDDKEFKAFEGQGNKLRNTRR